MTQSHQLSRLRFGLASLYALQQREHTTTTPGLHHLLPIPIRERLILLATIDGANEREIRKAIKVSKDDATLKSRRMKRTLQRVKTHLATPLSYWPDVWTRADLTPDGDLTNGIVHEDSQGIAWNRRYGASLEVQLGRLLWSDVAVALIGQSVPPSVAALSLKARLALYLLLVEQCTYKQTQELIHISEFQLESVVFGATKLLE